MAVIFIDLSRILSFSLRHLYLLEEYQEMDGTWVARLQQRYGPCEPPWIAESRHPTKENTPHQPFFWKVDSSFLSLSDYSRLTCLVASTFAPAFKSLLTTWSCPICAPIHKGVAPSVLAASVFAPCSRRTSRIRKWPFWAAMNNAVAPSYKY